jgi:hypothetical protein
VSFALLLLSLAFEHGVCALGCFCTAQRGDGVLGLGMGVLDGVAFCAFEVGVEDGNWTGPDREWRDAYKDCIKIGNRTGIHKIRLYCTKTV